MRLILGLGAALAVTAGATAAEPTTAAGAGVRTAPTTTDVLNACQSAIGNQPRTAMQGCLKSRYQDAHKKMDAAYSRAHTALEKIDSSATKQALHSLKHAQDSFKSFMNKECKRQGDALLGGSGAGDVEQACRVALTEWRTAALGQN
jgi:uncharacterized protein YecT (DUF1311 family)